MRLTHRHIQLWRRILRIARGVLDHNALVPTVGRALFRTGKWHRFHAEITPNSVLQMHHIIAGLQIGEVDIERRLHRRAVPAFHTARPLHFISAKHLRITHHDPAPGAVEESTTQGAERDVQLAAFRFKPVLRPQLLQTLLFARVVAEHEHGLILATPAVELGKKFAPLRLDNLWISHAPFHWAELLQTRQLQRQRLLALVQLMQIDTNQPAFLKTVEQQGPFHMKPVARRYLHHLLRRRLVQRIRIAKEHNRILRQML